MNHNRQWACVDGVGALGVVGSVMSWRSPVIFYSFGGSCVMLQATVERI